MFKIISCVCVSRLALLLSKKDKEEAFPCNTEPQPENSLGFLACQAPCLCFLTMENSTSRLRRIARHFEAMWTGLHRWEMGSERLRGLPNKPLVVTADITDFKMHSQNTSKCILLRPGASGQTALPHASTLRWPLCFSPCANRYVEIFNTFQH
jgi:hypothetical protein